MKSGFKNMIRLRLILLLLIAFQNLASAQIPAPNLRCVRRDTLIWDLPTVGCGTIQSYEIFASRNVTGPYQLLATITNTTQVRYFHNNLEGGVWFYYMQTNAQCTGQTRRSSDTLDNQPPNLNPVLVVSVLTNRSVEIRWRRNPAPEVVGYIVYKQTQSGLVPIATVPNRDSIRYVDNAATPSLKPDIYQVLAVDACGNTSLFDQSHNTIRLQATQSKCDQTISLKWNLYQNALTPIARQEIWVGENGRSAALIATLGARDTAYTLRNVTDRIRYTIFVRSVQSQSNVASRSSDTTLLADVIQPVTNLVMKNASVNEKSQVEIVWRWNRNAKIDSVRILRAAARDSGYTLIRAFRPPSVLDDEYFYVDTAVNAGMQSYFYRIETKDQCGVLKASNYAMTPHLTGKFVGNLKNQINWTRLLTPIGQPTGYQVYRIVNGVSTPVGLPLDTAVLDYTDVVGTDEPKVCYRIGAEFHYILADGTEEDATAYSNTICVGQLAYIWVPNAFAPTGKNIEFRPILNFVENIQSYKMEIFDRWGRKLFETTSPSVGWDGRRGAEALPPGAYTYFIQVIQATGEPIHERGIVVLIR